MLSLALVGLFAPDLVEQFIVPPRPSRVGSLDAVRQPTRSGSGCRSSASSSAPCRRSMRRRGCSPGATWSTGSPRRPEPMTERIVAIAPIPLARSIGRLLAVPFLLLFAGAVAVAGGANVGGLVGIGSGGRWPGASLGLALYLAVMLLSVRLDVQVATVQLRWLGASGGTCWSAGRSPGSRWRATGQRACVRASARLRLGGWPGRLRGDEAIDIVRLAPTAIDDPGPHRSWAAGDRADFRGAPARRPSPRRRGSSSGWTKSPSGREPFMDLPTGDRADAGCRSAAGRGRRRAADADRDRAAAARRAPDQRARRRAARAEAERWPPSTPRSRGDGHAGRSRRRRLRRRRSRPFPTGGSPLASCRWVAARRAQPTAGRSQPLPRPGCVEAVPARRRSGGGARASRRAIRPLRRSRSRQPSSAGSTGRSRGARAPAVRNDQLLPSALALTPVIGAGVIWLIAYVAATLAYP